MLQLHLLKMCSNTLSFASSLTAVLQWVLVISSVLFYDLACGQRRVDPALIEEYCKNFTNERPDKEFYSPMYPREYPKNISCFRTIEAPVGFLVRIDFRDVFRIEPPNNDQVCAYDYLEIRDGDQGYAPLIGKTTLHSGQNAHFLGS